MEVGSPKLEEVNLNLSFFLIHMDFCRLFVIVFIIDCSFYITFSLIFYLKFEIRIHETYSRDQAATAKGIEPE